MSIQKLEQAKATLEPLKALRTRLQIQLESARQQYTQAAAQAQAEYGTSSIEELKQRLKEIEAKNAEVIEAFCKNVELFGQQVRAVELALESPEALNAFLASQPAKPGEMPLAPLADGQPSSFPAEEDI